ncbi:TauD/TfdA family dioxygenase [Streptomyces sp. NRRL B-24484]|uniref:TauD/TfdA family dioxygenase n=1 Tax=Streptomyces sp. NRRL B-24484 TaxID=1463833 RepID=UPI0006936B46|nr:TauD/TfdA family dioxygenase [Streptomyces sp. NRRL B-24484]
MLHAPLTGPAAWHGPDLAGRDEWTVRLSPAHLAELDAALHTARGRGTTLLRSTAADFPLPTLATELDRIADELENGRGFALVKGVPVDRYDQAAAGTLLWGIGRHLGAPVSQNAAGHLLGHVRDTGRTMADPATRGYQTRTALGFHTDGSDVLALLCLRPAAAGGRIGLASAATVHNTVLARRPDLARRLYRRYAVDRREEHGPGERPYDTVPLACWHADRLSLRYHRCHLESAQRFPDAPRLEPADTELFDLIDESATSPAARLDLDPEAGDLLLVNNLAVLHSRSAYRDGPGHRRHLLRLWLALHRGRPLPPALWTDPHRADTGPGRGGVPPRDVIAPPHPADRTVRLPPQSRRRLGPKETTP